MKTHASGHARIKSRHGRQCEKARRMTDVLGLHNCEGGPSKYNKDPSPIQERSMHKVTPEAQD
ncbi:hypothetical protein KIN20_017802 [Parelaphostrongylus tenuis]|uniref:Uncharacterized protein n=1 Tax=Parelaphostrongylus tenuis TaxID=148309 RepID=A0AAD5N2W2_PARTN|nr:hypothetical protein KIN20_017802 [Parelaphostrongylus tenuis]